MNRQKQLIRVHEAQSQMIDLASQTLIKNFNSGASAIETTCVVSGYAKEVLAERIGKPREVLSRACNGRGSLDIDVLIDLMRESGSAMIIQYMAHQIGGEFRFLTDDEKEERELEERLESIRARRSA